MKQLMDAKSILDQLFSSSQSAVQSGAQVAKSASANLPSGATPAALLSGLGAGGAVALLFGSKGTRKFAKKALMVGGTAAVGGLAYKVISDWKTQSAERQHVETGVPIDALPTQEENQRSEVLVQAMISAARADGHIDELEQARITAQIKEAGVEQDVTKFLFAEMGKPLDPLRIAALADSPEAAAEVYLVSAIFIDKDNDLERRYLERLAEGLGLTTEVTEQLELQITNMPATH